MGIFDRLSRLVKSNVNAAIDSMSDPGKEIDQLVLEMEGAQRKARVEVQATLAAEKRSRQRTEALEKSVAEWGERAERALKAGDEALAKQALERQGEIGLELEEAARGLAEQARYADELTTGLKALDARVKEVKARKETLKIEARAKKSRETGTGANDAFARYEQLNTDIEVKEAEVALDEELAATRHEDAKSREVERKLEALGKNRDVEDRLAVLKAKLDRK